MMSFLRKCLAFIRRDFQIESSYKMSFVLNCLDSIVILIFFYFLNALMVAGGSHYAGRYGADYFSFVVIGVAFARYFQLTLRMFSESIRAAQLSGCLEAMLSSRTDSLTIVLLSSLYGLIFGAVQPTVILTAAAVFMCGVFTHVNVAATILILGVSLLTFV